MAARQSRPQSIALRLGVAMTLIFATVVVATVVAASRYGREAADEAFDRPLEGAAFQIAERVSVVDGKADVDLPVSAFELLSLARNDRVFYRVIGPDGATITGYDGLQPPTTSLGKPEQIYDSTFKGVRVRAVRLTRHLAERSVSGGVVVLVAQTTAERSALARSITTRAVAIIAFAGVALMVLAVVIVRVALRPLARIERTILSRDVNDLSPIEVPAPEEVAVLIAAVNRFMARLSRRIDGMQAFVAEAAHQLRTPITALRVQSQLALDETDPATLKRLNRRIHGRSIGLARLTDQLLSHALVAHRADTAALEPLDLRKVAIEAEREVRVVSDGSDAVALELPEEAVSARGDLVSLREAVKNLINNALRHGAPPVGLRVVPQTAESGAAILVRDGGAGFPDDLAARIGERFLSNGVDAESAGLGLSIVAAVVAAHQARLVHRRLPDGGFEVGLEMPRQAG
ncbi:two-component system, OmpR family, sensor histidine kinase TctE [Tistlia consotensis]|uniref:histidine kinase n=1 Tax=Tistlia consotensis USBA 355 TaxID=560819 RepID=A0A1Y6CS43_9PROT|nr:sensor histidine kinase [Tistlia consotensis]SMF73787.1 two-component system, OmpR family, sensor histidine kinase TctE [Tistlia consotensis USBA 355]SNS28813.1 two-component system, OmpR family, sensor histidine kinase TctE [Tistlia consotensis]